MSENPFGSIGESSGFERAQPVPVSSRGLRGHTGTIIGAVLVIAGFVWKFIAGDNADAGTNTLVASAWLLPIVVGGVMLARGLRSRN